MNIYRRLVYLSIYGFGNDVPQRVHLLFSAYQLQKMIFIMIFTLFLTTQQLS